MLASARRRYGRILLALTAFVAGHTAAVSGVADASDRRLTLPFSTGETWYVCQGYNANATHSGEPSLDISYSKDSVGPNACIINSTTANASTGRAVRSPASGVAYAVGIDGVCVNLTVGGSVYLGHLTDRIASGTTVSAEKQVGKVAGPNSNNARFSHVHLQAHSGTGCGSSPRIPFSDGSHMRFSCAPDLTDSGAANQHSGLALQRCVPGSQRNDVFQAVGGEIGWRLSKDGRGSWETLRASGATTGLMVGDFDNDGVDDIFQAAGDGVGWRYSSKGRGTWQSLRMSSTTEGLFIGDFE